jgi:YhcH/YjgK/YiaL family protein
MIADLLSNAERYLYLHPLFQQGFEYLYSTDLKNTPDGRYELNGEKLVAIVQSYETKPTLDEQMESHKRYIDIQYIISGTELVGHAFLQEQTIAKPYSAKEDFMLYEDQPDFFSKFHEGMFMIFYPTDLHLPSIQVSKSETVKKVVLKVEIQ